MVTHEVDVPTKTFVSFQVTVLNHGTIMRTGITCQKIPCYMHDLACWWFFVKIKKLKYIDVMLNIFQFSGCE